MIRLIYHKSYDWFSRCSKNQVTFQHLVGNLAITISVVFAYSFIFWLSNVPPLLASSSVLAMALQVPMPIMCPNLPVQLLQVGSFLCRQSRQSHSRFALDLQTDVIQWPVVIAHDSWLKHLHPESNSYPLFHYYLIATGIKEPVLQGWCLPLQTLLYVECYLFSTETVTTTPTAMTYSWSHSLWWILTLISESKFQYLASLRSYQVSVITVNAISDLKPLSDLTWLVVNILIYFLLAPSCTFNLGLIVLPPPHCVPTVRQYG